MLMNLAEPCYIQIYNLSDLIKKIIIHSRGTHKLSDQIPVEYCIEKYKNDVDPRTRY